MPRLSPEGYQAVDVRGDLVMRRRVFGKNLSFPLGEWISNRARLSNDSITTQVRDEIKELMHTEGIFFIFDHRSRRDIVFSAAALLDEFDFEHVTGSAAISQTRRGPFKGVLRDIRITVPGEETLEVIREKDVDMAKELRLTADDIKALQEATTLVKELPNKNETTEYFSLSDEDIAQARKAFDRYPI